MIPVLSQWVKDPALLWLWCRLAATALMRPLAWDPPCAVGEALENAKRQKKIEIKIIDILSIQLFVMMTAAEQPDQKRSKQ